METTPEQELKKVINKWQTAYYISDAMLTDYSEQMSKITGETAENIKKRITEKANQNLQADKEKKS